MFVNLCCYHSQRFFVRSLLIRSFQTSSQRPQLRKNYYEILGLETDCSQKEIRNAFVTLSKECHPDTNAKSGTSEEKLNQEFIKVMEAYQVLSKTHSRANYDLSLRGIDTVNYVQRDTVYEPWKVDPASYSEKGPKYSPYYGVKGVKRMSNWKIVMACVMFCSFGVMLQAIAITKSVTFKREQLDKFSAVNSSKHEKARGEAERYGNTEQIERVRQRLVKSEMVFDNSK